MRGIGPLNLLIGVSLAFVIGTSTDSYTQTTALRGARVMNEATRGTHSSCSASSIPRFSPVYPLDRVSSMEAPR